MAADEDSTVAKVTLGIVLINDNPSLAFDLIKQSTEKGSATAQMVYRWSSINGIGLS